MDSDQSTNQPPKATPEAAQAPPVNNSNSKPKKSKKLLVGGIVAAALLLLGGGGAFAYTAWYQNPDKVVHDAIVNVIKANTASLTGDISIKAEGLNINLDLDSRSDGKNGEFNIKSDVAIDMDGFKQSFKVDGSSRMIENTLYVKLSGIQEAFEEAMAASGLNQAVPEQATSIIEKIDNQWISIQPSDYEDVSQEVSEQQDCMTALTEKIHSDKDMRDDIVKLYKDNQIIVIAEELGSKDVNGTSSLGYKVDTDKDAAVGFVRGLGDTAIGKEMKTCSEEVNFGEMADDIAEMDETNSSDFNLKTELWVSRFGHQVTEVSISGSNQDSSLSAVLQPVFDKSANVEAPKDAIPLKDLLEEVEEMVSQAFTPQAYPSDFDSSAF